MASTARTACRPSPWPMPRGSQRLREPTGTSAAVMAGYGSWPALPGCDGSRPYASTAIRTAAHGSTLGESYAAAVGSVTAEFAPGAALDYRGAAPAAALLAGLEGASRTTRGTQRRDEAI